MRWDVRAFDLLAPLYDAFMWRVDELSLRKGLAVADRDLERTIEVGGGSGRVAQAIEAVVVDPARGMLKRARGRELEAVQASAADLPHPDGSVDAVVVVDALHHFPEQHRCLEEMARVLAPGGVLVVRDFDPETRRGRAIGVAETLMGFDSTFHPAAELEADIESVGLDPRPIEYGFELTIAGVKPATEA
jgi:demethylmenaquinone methyltransferase/2-methoxy-6-polyprenyl-1,4-benzoquinol methylase